MLAPQIMFYIYLSMHTKILEKQNFKIVTFLTIDKIIEIDKSYSNPDFLQVCCGRVCSLMRDASHVLSSKTIARVLASAQHVLAQAADSPFLFLTSQFVSFFLNFLKYFWCFNLAPNLIIHNWINSLVVSIKRNIIH